MSLAYRVENGNKRMFIKLLNLNYKVLNSLNKNKKGHHDLLQELVFVQISHPTENKPINNP